MTEAELLRVLSPYVKAPKDGELDMPGFLAAVRDRIAADLANGSYINGPNCPHRAKREALLQSRDRPRSPRPS